MRTKHCALSRRIPHMLGPVTGSQTVRIALIAPPGFTVPPTGYGGIEQVVSNLVEGLVEGGA